MFLTFQKYAINVINDDVLETFSNPVMLKYDGMTVYFFKGFCQKQWFL